MGEGVFASARKEPLARPCRRDGCEEVATHAVRYTSEDSFGQKFGHSLGEFCDSHADEYLAEVLDG